MLKPNFCRGRLSMTLWTGLVSALANHYETSLQTSTQDFKPLLKPHRDDVGEADLSVVIGISPKSDFQGAMLYVSNVKDGWVWYDRKQVPSRRSVVRVEVIEGTFIVLRNKVEHYVSCLQQGSRGSLVFHMTKCKSKIWMKRFEVCLFCRWGEFCVKPPCSWTLLHEITIGVLL